MAFKDIISFGIGFAPGSVSFMPTIGFSMPSAPGPGTGEYLERFDVYGGPSRRMDVKGSPLGTRLSVRGGDGDNE